MTCLITTDKSFDSDLKLSTELVLVDFWAEWCGPCKQIGPILEEISDDMKDDLKIFKLDVDQNTETPQKYGVRGIPTLMLFKEGKLIDTKVGSLPKNSLIDWVKNNL